jgi:hypothetical protein
MAARTTPPSAPPGGTVTITATANLSSADASATANSGTFDIQSSPDQITWTTVTTHGWQGGVDPKSGGPMDCTVSWQPWILPAWVRVSYDLPASAAPTFNFS